MREHTEHQQIDIEVDDHSNSWPIRSQVKEPTLNLHEERTVRSIFARWLGWMKQTPKEVDTHEDTLNIGVHCVVRWTWLDGVLGRVEDCRRDCVTGDVTITVRVMDEGMDFVPIGNDGALPVRPTYASGGSDGT